MITGFCTSLAGIARALSQSCQLTQRKYPEERVIPEYSVMSQAELAEHLRDLPQRPLFVDADGELRLSLAGVHNKAAVIRIKNELALTKGRTPTTHIVKVDIVGLPDSIRVENYCLHLARAMGIDAVTSQSEWPKI